MSIYELSLLRISHWSSVIGRGAFRYDHGGSGTGMWLAGRQPRATGKSEQIRAAPLAVLVALPKTHQFGRKSFDVCATFHKLVCFTELNRESWR